MIDNLSHSTKRQRDKLEIHCKNRICDFERESDLVDYLCDNVLDGIEYVTEYSISIDTGEKTPPRGLYRARCDIYLPEYNIGIECKSDMSMKKIQKGLGQCLFYKQMSEDISLSAIITPETVKGNILDSYSKSHVVGSVKSICKSNGIGFFYIDKHGYLNKGYAPIGFHEMDINEYYIS